MAYDQNKKEYYSNLKYNGYKWAGYWDERHNFTREEEDGKYNHIQCTDEMLNNGDIQTMTKLGLTYPAKNNNHGK